MGEGEVRGRVRYGVEELDCGKMVLGYSSGRIGFFRGERGKRVGRKIGMGFSDLVILTLLVVWM